MEKKEYKISSRNCEPKMNNEDDLECAVCLQTCVHPVRLPCTHIFCFLCVKGVANQSKRCAMCRQEIPADFLDNPNLLKKVEEKENEPEGYQWFYEGRNGWWQYDERTSKDLENAYSGGERVFEVLVAGFLYTVDFDRMVQQRRNDPSRRRRIKRDLSSIPKKGVAGLKTADQLPPQAEQQILPTPSATPVCDQSPVTSASEDDQVNEVTSSSDGVAPASPSRVESARPAPEYQELECLQLLHSNVHRTLHRDIPSSSSSRSASDVRRARITRRTPRRGSNTMCLRSGTTTFRNRSNSVGAGLQVRPDDTASVEEASIGIQALTLEAEGTEVQFYSLDDTEEYSLPNNNEDL